MLDLLVAADDRTGALEVAGMCADRIAHPVLVVTGRSTPSNVPAVVVVDLDSRHCSPDEAADRAAAIDDVHPARVSAHKIDSTLRGNWHHEVVRRSAHSDRRALVVPAFPSLRRTCVDGIVRVDGIDVSDGPAGTDPLAPLRSSRPSELLAAAGVDGVDELRGAADVVRWATSGRSRFAVCDARTDGDLRTIAAAWVPHARGVLFAGTAAAIASAVGALAPPAAPPSAGPGIGGPVLVVCGSLHPAARRQLEVLRTARPDVEILATPLPAAGSRLDAASAHAAATALAQRAHRRLVDGGHRTVVILGGDTAAAWLGDRSILVGGTVATGLPWMRGTDGAGPLVLTRSGGFGDDHALVDLLRTTAGTDPDRHEGTSA